MKPTIPTVVYEANRFNGGELTAFAPDVSRNGDAASADRELEANVLIDLSRSRVDAAPTHETNREAMLARADLGEHADIGGQQHADEARLLAAVERTLIQAARGDPRRRRRRFAREPKHLGDGVANRLDVARPLVELLAPFSGRQMQPIGVVG